jgi:hypothetical protein
VLLVVAKLALVAVAVGPDESPAAVLLAVAILALVAVAVGPDGSPVAVELVVAKLALVAVAVGPDESPAAVLLAVAILALVAAAVGPGLNPVATGLAFEKRPRSLIWGVLAPRRHGVRSVPFGDSSAALSSPLRGLIGMVMSAPQKASGPVLNFHPAFSVVFPQILSGQLCALRLQ